MKYTQHSARAAITLATSLTLLACGGGSGETEPSAPPPPPANIAPAITAIAAVATDERTTVEVQADATDSDGTIASYAWTQLDGPTLTLAGEDTDTLTLTAPTVTADSTATLSLTVTDDDGESATTTVSVTVINTHKESTLSGVASIAGEPIMEAAVAFTHGQSHFTGTTDAAGHYALAIALPVDYPTSPYQLVVEGDSGTVTRAGYPTELFAAEQQSQAPVAAEQGTASTSATGNSATAASLTLALDEVTTAEAELLQSLYDADGDFLSATFASIDAFSAEFEHVSTERLVTLAAFMAYLKDTSTPAPSPLSFAALFDMMSELKRADESFTATLATYIEQLTNTRSRASTSFVPELPVRIYPLLESAKGSVRLGINFNFVYDFDADNVVTIMDEDGTPHQGAWSIADDGSIEVTYAATGNFAWQSGACTHTSVKQNWYIVKERQVAADAAEIRVHWQENCEGELRTYTNSHFTSLVTAQQLHAFDDDELPGQVLALPLPQPEGENGDNHAVALLAFNDNGQGVVRGTNEAFEFDVDEHALNLTFANGDALAVLKSQRNKRGAIGVITLYTASSGEVFTNKSAAVYVDEQLSFTTAAEAAGVYRSGFDLSQPNNRREFGFTITLEENGQSNQVLEAEQEWVLPSFERDSVWQIDEQGHIGIAVRADFTDQGYMRCDPETNPDCYTIQYRTWEPLAESGNRVYVLETIYQAFSLPEDNRDLPPRVDARINFYKKQ